MKKLFSVSILALIISTFSFAASAQIIIIEPGCDVNNPCNRAPAVKRVTPRYYAPPVAVRRPVARKNYYVPRATVPNAPVGIGRSYSAPLHRWGLGLLWNNAVDDDGTLTGGGFTLQYMFSRYWGIEGELSGLSSDEYVEYGYKDIFRAALSAVWYPGGVKMSGISWYGKLGIVSQDVSRYDNYAYSRDSYNNDYYNDSYSNASGSTMQFGGGLTWRMLDGYLSFSLEAMIVGSMSDDQNYGDDVSSSLNIRFISSIHF